MRVYYPRVTVTSLLFMCGSGEETHPRLRHLNVYRTIGVSVPFRFRFSYKFQTRWGIKMSTPLTQDVLSFTEQVVMSTQD